MDGKPFAALFSGMMRASKTIPKEEHMNLRTVFAAAAATVTLAACGGQGGPAADKGPISAERTAAFKRMMPEFAVMGKMVKGDEAFSQGKFKELTAVFTQNAKKPFDHFQNDPQGNGDALPAVWTQPDDFKSKQSEFFAAVDELNAQSQNGRLEGITAAYNNVGASCKSCHDVYRRPK